MFKTTHMYMYESRMVFFLVQLGESFKGLFQLESKKKGDKSNTNSFTFHNYLKVFNSFDLSTF